MTSMKTATQEQVEELLKGKWREKVELHSFSNEEIEVGYGGLPQDR